MSDYEIYVLGISHHSAAVKQREKAALGEERCRELLGDISQLADFAEVCVLSTCNRTELYAVAHVSNDVRRNLWNALLAVRPELTEQDSQCFYFLSGREAAGHLFRVTPGLDSMILGEPQILGQVKEAFQRAVEEGTVSTYLTRLFEMAFLTAKRVRSETAIAVGAVSVAYAAVELAHKVFRNLAEKTVLLIGSGETGQLTARHLIKKGVQKIYIANRTFAKAQELALTLGGIACPLDGLKEMMAGVDLIVGATSAPSFILTRSDVEKVLAKRPARPLFMIDIAVPRNFDPEIQRFDNVFLHDIDSLQQIVDRNLESRKAQVAAAEEIVKQELDHFLRWRETLDLAPTIVSLRKKLEDIRNAELSKYRHRASPHEYEIAEQATRGVINKILHLPMSQLRRYSNGNLDGIRRIDVLREIFGLESGSDE